jgi:lysophospholipase L1-like esterase
MPVVLLKAKRSVLWRALVLILMLVAQFALLEAGLRFYGSFEGTSTFQSLFMNDPQVGVRLRPNARIRYSTVEFTTDIAINAQGVRDDEAIGPKAPDERRIVVLGDSLVLSVQVSVQDTFCKKLEERLNARGGPQHWRVINGGVQGYGPVNEWLFFDHVAAAFQPDVVLIVAFVGNDAIEAADAAAAFEAGRPVAVAQPGVIWARRLVRSSVVLQSARMRWDELRSRITAGTPERPLVTYLTNPPPIVEQGLVVTRRAFEQIAQRARGMGASTGIVLMPARLQINDEDFGNLSAIVRAAGGELDRNGASRRFHDALAPLGLPMLDLEPVLASQPDRAGLFFQRTIHLTPRGHEVVAGALFDFLQAGRLVSAAKQAQ